MYDLVDIMTPFNYAGEFFTDLWVESTWAEFNEFIAISILGFMAHIVPPLYDMPC
jgi:hypothetical protein